jgi:hypothetical protein
MSCSRSDPDAGEMEGRPPNLTTCTRIPPGGFSEGDYHYFPTVFMARDMAEETFRKILGSDHPAELQAVMDAIETTKKNHGRRRTMPA